VRHSAVYAALAGWSVATVPGALGRCDSGHTFLYGISAFLMTWVGLQKQNKSLYKAFVIVFLGSFVCLKGSNFVLSYRQGLPDQFRALIARLKPQPRTVAPPLPQGRPASGRRPPAAREAADYSRLDRFGPIASPCRLYDDTLYFYMLDKSICDYQYFDGGENVFLREHLDRKLAELGRARWILVPQSFVDGSEPMTFWEGEPHFLRRLFLFPYVPPKKRDALNPDLEVRNYIRATFEVADTWTTYYVMAPKISSGVTNSGTPRASFLANSAR